MSEPYIGEIRMFAGNFEPLGWSFCRGQLLQIAEDDVLFNLIGTTYGGDGQETFALPDLRGRVPVHIGNVFGRNFTLGEMAGVEVVTLTQQQMPAHTHPLSYGNGTRTQTPENTLLASAQSTQAGVRVYSTSTDGRIALSPSAINPQGGNQPHENMQPYLAINFIISRLGVYPSPS